MTAELDRFRWFNGEAFSFQRALLLLDERCNGRCRYCFERDKSGTYASLELVTQVVATLKLVERRKQSPQLHLFGGEPTLHPEFASVLDCAARSNVGVVLYTNGTFESDVLDAIVRHSSTVRHVQVSIDGTPETHAIGRRASDGRTHFDRIIENYRALASAGIDTCAHAVLCRETIGHLAENAAFLRGLGQPSRLPIFNIADPLRWTADDVEAYRGQLTSLSHRLLSEIRALPDGSSPYYYLEQFRQAMLHPAGLPPAAYPCLFGMGRVGLCVAADGSIFYCHLHYFGLKDKGLRPSDHRIGHVEWGIDWPRLDEFRSAKVADMKGCHDCKGYGCVPRVCMLANLNSTGDCFTPDPRVCRIYRAGIEVFEEFAKAAGSLESTRRDPASLDPRW